MFRELIFIPMTLINAIHTTLQQFSASVDLPFIFILGKDLYRFIYHTKRNTEITVI